jgi:hypothetical protein
VFDVPAEHRDFFAEVARDTTSLVAGRQLGSGTWLHTREPVGRVREEWRRLRPLVEWLAAQVGPRRRG